MSHFGSWKADGQVVINLAVPRNPEGESPQKLKLEKAKNQTNLCHRILAAPG